MTEADHEASYRLGRLAFGGPPTLDEAWRFWARSAVGLLAEQDGRLVGQLRVRPYGQLFGGRSAPMRGLAGVAVEPEARGRGVAQALLDASLPAMHEAGQAVSALYPSVPPPTAAAGGSGPACSRTSRWPRPLSAPSPRPAPATFARPGPPTWPTCTPATSPWPGPRTACSTGVRLQARALGPWFAGGTPTSALRLAGLLDGADADLLDALVSGRGAPRMADHF